MSCQATWGFLVIGKRICKTSLHVHHFHEDKNRKFENSWLWTRRQRVKEFWIPPHLWGRICTKPRNSNQGPRTWEQGCNFCFKGGFLGLLGIVFQFDAMIMNIFDVICYPWRLCALFPPSHLCVPVILVLLGFGLDLNLFNSFECSTLSWAEILKCCSNECCLCCPWIYLLVSLVPLLEVYLGENPLYFQLAWKCRIVGLLWILSGSAGKESTQNQTKNVKILLETQQGVHG